VTGVPRLLFVFREGWARRLQAIEEGAIPAETHGYFVLRDSGIDVDAVDSKLRVGWYWRLASQLYQRLYVIPRSGTGYRFHQARAVRAYLESDAGRWVVATTESLGLPLLALKARGRLPNPLAVFSIGLGDRVRRGVVSPRLVRRYRRLFAHAAAILVFDAGEAELLGTWAPATPIGIMPYGVDVEWWRNSTSAAAGNGHIISVGSDSNRNFKTLVTAVDGLPITTIIVSAIARRQGISSGPFIRIVEDASMLSLRELLWHAQLVVLPIRNVKQPSGQSSALQAMAAGKPVIFTDTGWARRHGLRDGLHFVHVPPDDAASLRSAIESVLALPDRGAGMGARARTVLRENLTPAHQARVILDTLAAAS
jgi:glycosyltransferase involved in cell wall biosynthesis